jgi:hypothetical protein
MPVYGDLRTVSLSDLLRWASRNEKTGVLEVERNAISRRVEFRKGWVGSCSSNDPSARLGQYLLSRGRVNETQLHHLLMLQRVTEKRLGLLLVDMNILTRSELATVVASKAQEIIRGLFDWDDAFFRFDDGATLDPDQIEVNLSVEELITEGEKRRDTLREIRGAFESSGTVLERTDLEVPEEILESRMMRRVLDAIDGRRTVAEILLHTRASEFLVLSFLHQLFVRGMVTVRDVRPIPTDHTSLLDRDGHTTDSPLRSPLAPGEIDRALANMDLATGMIDGPDLDLEIDTAQKLIEQEEYEAAIELLRWTCREHATDYVRRLLSRAETSFVQSVRADDAFVSKIPVLLKDRQLLLEQQPSPEESFLLTLIDGTTDVQSILWLAPLREVDVFIGLRRMVRKNLIELAAPEPVEDELEKALV